MNLKLMKKLCTLREDKLKKILVKFLKNKGYKNIIYNKDFLIAEGQLPICLVAHLDTVFQFLPKWDDFLYDSKKNVLWYPGGSGFDDRAGIYAIIELVNKGYFPHIIFTDKEEYGGIGAKALIQQFPQPPFEAKAIIELDRANENDMVFYNCDNVSFEKYIGQFGFELSWGTFTDISIIAPEWRIAAVNVSIGYIDEHTQIERLYCDWCDKTIERVGWILEETSKDTMPFFEYIPYKLISYTHHSALETSSCLLCGKQNGTLYKIDDNGFSYYLCEPCYHQCYH